MATFLIAAIGYEGVDGLFLLFLGENGKLIEEKISREYRLIFKAREFTKYSLNYCSTNSSLNY